MTPKRIIIHHSLTRDGQTVSWQAIRRYHMETLGWLDVGYHFGVELVGDRYEVLMGRPLHVIGAHTLDHNVGSLGICFVGNFDLAPPPTAQLELGIRLVRGLMEVLRILPEHVTRHSDHAAKSCPGARFPWADFLRRL